jgi:hypothetical protein
MNTIFTAKLTRVLSIGIAAVLVLMPFHAFLTVWLASVFGHYTLLRLWKEFVLLLIGLIAAGLVLRDKPLRTLLRTQRLILLIAVYVILQLFLGVTAALHHQVSDKALAYGVLDDARFPLFFVVCTALALRDNWLRQHWRPLVLLPAALVVLFALLQIFVLPHNVLQHFGYGPNTIPIVQTVNSNAHYVRAQSTLRGANPLGAYLVLVIAILAALFLKSKAMRTKAIYGSSGLLTLIALYLTYSRGAWIGAALVLGACLLAVIKTKRTAEFVMLGVLLLAVVASVVTLSFRHNAHFENVIFHSSPHTVATTSDQNHSSALRAGIHDVIHDPLGRGPGTAGPASVYNYDRPARDPENYFVQIGQELGWLGLVLFILINVVLAQVLWQARREPLALALFASLIGISFVGLVSEVWTDDTLCYVWWGLAGIVMATQLQLPKLKAKL